MSIVTGSSPNARMSEFPLRCRCRKQAPTSLRCARCSVPICPACSVVAPAGQLCGDCGGVRSSSRLYTVPAPQLAATAAATLAAALLGGWLLAAIRLGPFFNLWIGYLYGLGIAEVSLRVSGRKRGTHMELLAGICVAVGILGGWALRAPAIGLPPMQVVTAHLKYLWDLILAGVAIFAAVTRVRNIR